MYYIINYAINFIGAVRAAAALQSLKDSWQNTPPTWEESDDPCGASWEGVTCNNSRVTALYLFFFSSVTFPFSSSISYFLFTVLCVLFSIFFSQGIINHGIKRETQW